MAKKGKKGGHGSRAFPISILPLVIGVAAPAVKALIDGKGDMIRIGKELVGNYSGISIDVNKYEWSRHKGFIYSTLAGGLTSFFVHKVGDATGGNRMLARNHVPIRF